MSDLHRPGVFVAPLATAFIQLPSHFSGGSFFKDYERWSSCNDKSMEVITDFFGNLSMSENMKTSLPL